MKTKNIPLLVACSTALLFLAPLAKGATVLTFDYDTVREVGVTPPAGSLTAIFTSIDASNVSLTLNANFVGSEFVSKIGFNVPQDIYAHTLTWTIVGSSGSFAAPTVGGAWNGGNGTGFPLHVSFATKNSDRFNANDNVTFNISYSGSKDFGVDSFNTLDKSGQVLSHAHVQSIGSNGSSAWVSPTVAVPEPSIAFLGGLGILALLRRRKA